MKKSRLKILAAVIIIFVVNGFLFAQTDEERIKFARGKSSATVSNTLPAEQVRVYVLFVKKGQRIQVKVSSANSKVDVDGANISAGEFEESGNKSFDVPIDATGDYRIYVRNTGKTAARFTLSVTVR